MESASVAVPTPSGVEDKGLKKNAIGFISATVIGVASTAPGYSLAATLGLVTAVVGFQAPAIMLIAFLPMLLIALAYKYMNRADPDCGTTFSWVTKAMGPHLGWMGGWGIILADIIVMANLSQIAGLYSFQLFGNNSPTTFEVTLVGVIWIVVMTWICWRGVELSARTQQFLLGAEFLTLLIFAVVALVKVYSGDAPADLAGSVALLAQPVRHLVGERADLRRAAGDLHLLGMGHRGDGERGDGGHRRSRRAARRSSRRSCSSGSTWSSPAPPSPTPARIC